MNCDAADLAWEQLGAVRMEPPINPLLLAQASGFRLVYVDGDSTTGPLTPGGAVVVDLSLSVRERSGQIFRGIAQGILRRHGLGESAARIEGVARELALPLPWMCDEYELLRGDLGRIEARHPFVPVAWIADMGDDLLARPSLRPLRAVRETFRRMSVASATRH